MKKTTILLALATIFLIGCSKKEVPVQHDYDKTRNAAEKSWGGM